jgi:negative regulator of flagellin synthesis FlgM
MTIKNIFGNQSVGPLAAAKGAQKAKSGKLDQAPPTDRVEFSAVLQQVGRPGEVSGSAAAQRAQKIAEIKAQVASGNYQPDLTKVAASLLKFISEEN